MRKMINMKWILSVVLVMILSLSLFTLGAFAEGASETESETEKLEETNAATESESGDETEASTEAETDGETDDADAGSGEAPKMIFEPGNFIKWLPVMGAGLLGIFIVIGVIVLSVVVLNKVTAPRKKNDDDTAE